MPAATTSPMLPSRISRALISQYPTLRQYTPSQMTSPSTHRSQIIHAPSPAPTTGTKSVFLAGTTTTTTTTTAPSTADWRETLSASLRPYPLTIFNPARPDWDSTWREDITFAPYREQVQWELDKQATADLVVVYFHPATVAPVSLLEFGLAAGQSPGKVVAVAPEGYAKRGNVQIVCEKFGIEFLDDIDRLHESIVNKLSLDR
ncbi:hypothetical protein LARI1_G004052 [Lachnellula arida]|uniref:Uncharacterized protein n=1 Tax=Lachnellula arida TaxID=1316785 RepID=A0A8T9BG75_9HELO|nr:hypothetical protein LARI1_G004052 [Lachnellula arida]